MEKTGHDIVLVPNSEPADDLSFQCYHQYTRNGVVASKSNIAEGCSFAISSNQEYDLLCRAHILGSNMRDVDFQTVIMDALLCRYKEVDELGQHGLPTASVVKMVYKRTKGGSLLRKFLVDIYVWAGLEEVTRSTLMSSGVPQDFVHDLLKIILREHASQRNSRDIPTTVSCCDYHGHGKSEQCRSRKRKRSGEDEDDDFLFVGKSESPKTPSIATDTKIPLLGPQMVNRSEGDKPTDSGHPSQTVKAKKTKANAPVSRRVAKPKTRPLN